MIRKTKEVDFGKSLFAAMRKRNMTQADLVRESGIGQTSISQLVNGKADPTLFTLIEIAKALDMSLDDLTGFRREASEDEKNRLRALAVALIEDTREIYGELQALNKHARMLERWARKYKLIEEEEE